MVKNEVVQTMSLNIKFSYLAENSKFSRSNSYFSILTPTFLRDGFLNSCFQNPGENSVSLLKPKMNNVILPNGPNFDASQIICCSDKLHTQYWLSNNCRLQQGTYKTE